MSSSSPYKVVIAQVEYIRNNAYFPDTSAANGTVNIIDGSTSSHAACPGFSDHATQVFNRLIGGFAQGLIGTIIPIEAVSFMYPRTQYGLNAGRTLDPNVPAWDMENHSWGGSDPLWENDSPTSSSWNSTWWGTTLNYIPGILSRQVKRVEKYNIISLVALPDSDMVATRLLAAAKSRNIIKVGSAHGEVTTSEYTPDVIYEDPQADYTSYDDPDIGQTVAVMISYLKTNNINYNAGDVAQIVKDVAKSNNLYHNHAQCIAQLQLHYPITTLSPDPTPVVTTPVVVTPTPIVNQPPTTPVSNPTPSPAITPTLPAPGIYPFWNSSGGAPCQFVYSIINAVSSYIIDPNGQKVIVPVDKNGTVNVTANGQSPNNVTWQFVALQADGQTYTKTMYIHAVFTAADIASISGTPIPTAPVVTPTPVVVAPAPVDPLIAVANNLGLNYNTSTKTFANLTVAQIKSVASSLQALDL